MEHLRDQRGHRHNVRHAHARGDYCLSPTITISHRCLWHLFVSFTRWTVDGGRSKEFISNEIIGSSGDYNVLKHSEDYGGAQQPSQVYELTSTRDTPWSRRLAVSCHLVIVCCLQVTSFIMSTSTFYRPIVLVIIFYRLVQCMLFVLNNL